MDGEGTEKYMIAYTCRICGHSGSTPVPDGYDEAKHGQWIPALCHNRCFDIREKRLKLEARVCRVCRVLELSDDSEVVADARKKLSDVLRAWAQNEADFFGSKILYWSEEFVDLVASKPDRWPVALKMNRDYIRQSVSKETV